MADEFQKTVISQKYFEGDYLQMLKGLFPPGPIWGWDKVSFLTAIQDCIACSSVWQDTIAAPDVVQDSIDPPADAAGSVLGRYMSVVANELSRLETKAWSLLEESDPGMAVDLLEDWERVLDLPGECGGASSIADRQRAAHAKYYDEFRTTTEQFFIDYAEKLGFVVTIRVDTGDLATYYCGASRCGAARCNGSAAALSYIEITIVSGIGDVDNMKCIFNRIKPAHAIIIWIE